ncbi:DUF6603 domain-containing protein [Nonomuraea zeae]|uniref:DUF6603 domain-containing protein n=1 Tax=Nonomuraea zeae TaxID=1642303 RepID=A0A5S4FYU7_9ACTN|nr:DUF6603 domain-containing protein [Nonomuraea zeae]TMR25878.1 hypothetical protein ETD85_44465 [Nonomuraea zeae]
MAELGTFDRLVAEVGQALLPLRQALGSTDAFVGLLNDLGWTASDIPQPLRDLGTDLDTLDDALRRLLGDGGVNLGGAQGDPGAEPAGGVSADEAARVLAAAQGVVNGIRAIVNAPDSAIPAALRADGFRTVFPGQLIDYLIITYLQRFHPAIGFALRALGVIKSVYAPATGGRPPHMRLTIDAGDLAQVLADPSVVLKNAYGWGEPGFDYPALASQIDNLLMSAGLDVFMTKVEPDTAQTLQGVPPDPYAAPPEALTVSIFDRQVSDTARTSAAVRLIRLPGQGAGAPGLAVLPSFSGDLGLRLELGPDLAVTIRSDLDLQGGVGLLIRPGEPVEMILGFESGQGPVHATGSIEARVERDGTGGEPVVLLGAPDRTRLQFRTVAGAAGVRLAGGEVDVFAELDVQGLEFVFKPDDTDGFIAAILPGDGFTVGADLAVGISHKSGFYFRGTSNLEIELPVREQIGPIELQGLTLAANPSNGAVPVELGASFKAVLGPITAVVDRIGLRALFTGRPEHDGNLGPVDVSLGFKPPTGAGLSVDAGVVSGGGFLSFDTARGEYAGAMELEFADFLQLKALGLISTRMPDGSSGFSLLIVITAEFGTGIQLGLGFTLKAVGGLIGLNRRMNLQALVEGVRSGAIESVAFPRDVIANAPRILSDLSRFFPPQQGTFLIGPMAKIGWGTPTLVSIDLGVIIEIPGNIAVLGVLRAVLPTQDLQLLVLQVDFLGAFEPGKSRLWFFARLFESRILTMTLDGEMGVLVAWGDSKELIVTVGGFHPSYRPPPLPFPVPKRMTVDLLNSGGQLIRATGYFAITANTIQFGAGIELRLGFDDFGIEGHLAFDALFQKSPFAFSAHVNGDVTLKVFGIGAFTINLDFRLEGPAPYRAHGRGSIGFLFFEVSADFDRTWGDELGTLLPPVLVLPLLATEIGKIESWATRLPSGDGKALVNLRRLPDTGELVLHPLGTLSVRQRAVPLGVRVDRVGGQRASDGKRFSLTPAPGSGLTRAAVTGDKFAMAQYQDMSDAAKLSRPSFETQDAGLELTAAAGALASPRVVRRSARYELHIIDGGTAASPQAARARAGLAATAAPKRFHNVNPAVYGELLGGSSTARAPLSQRESRLRQPFAAADTVQVTDQRYVVAYVRSNLQAFPPRALTRPATAAPASAADEVPPVALLGAAAATFRNRTTATDALAEWVAADPGLDGRLHVIAASEASASLAEAGTWMPAGLLPAPASGIDAVPLAGGKVLVAGGADADGVALAAAALFDPTGNAWAAAAPLATGRRLHTTTRLPDGRVIAAGGRSADGTVLASAEIYDPAAGAWSAAPAPMGAARAGHSATVLHTGRLLIAGGTAPRPEPTGAVAGSAERAGGALASVELFDPVTRAWSAAQPMTDARTGHQAVLLDDGRVLVTGGALPTGDGNERAIAYCEIYDPATGAWTPTGSLATPRKGHQATLLPDGRVLVTGGDAVVAADGTFSPRSLASAELYDPVAGSWTPAAGMPGGRSRHRAILTGSGVVLVVGGTGAPAFTAGYRNVAAYDPQSGTWTSAAGPALGRSAFAVAELSDQRVLIAGGVAAGGAAAPGPEAAQQAATAEILIP